MLTSRLLSWSGCGARFKLAPATQVCIQVMVTRQHAVCGQFDWLISITVHQSFAPIKFGLKPTGSGEV